MGGFLLGDFGFWRKSADFSFRLTEAANDLLPALVGH
jgi:hypothetical protein